VTNTPLLITKDDNDNTTTLSVPTVGPIVIEPSEVTGSEMLKAQSKIAPETFVQAMDPVPSETVMMTPYNACMSMSFSIISTNMAWATLSLIIHVA
jgi:hypothetical protein